jgi:menaquinone-dependent protoporphyrinogen oxidase
MIKVLIVYGTRYGATAMTSEEIADVLRQEGFDVKVVNLKNEKITDISKYDLLVVGSGIRVGKWTKESQKFIKKFQIELANKQVAIFVCCGAKFPLEEKTDKEKEIENARMKYLEEKIAEYDLQPIAMGLFGGVYNFNKMGWFFRKTMSKVRSQLKEAEVKQTKPGLFDTRDLGSIRGWAKEVAQKVKAKFYTNF